ncbi:unnamed protein product [Linum trigynum]|uniref:F-box domain-containing protein n=1 Tax=Linum trigynum TaxID=586398 RepID=A0AAV2FAE5_9ROSI
MKQQGTWPPRSDGHRFRSFPMPETRLERRKSAAGPPGHSQRPRRIEPRSSSTSKVEDHGFAALPFDILARIAAPFTLPNLQAASLVCKSWSEALQPLREAMLLLRWGKRFKHGRGGVKSDLNKALDSFLKGAARGSSLAMVDAGLVYWEIGEKEKAVGLYRKAAELGDPAGQCNLGIYYLQAKPPNETEAVKWLFRASIGGHVRAQYQLGLCLHQGRGVEGSLQEAAKWYLRAARGGYVRAMYNVALCYSVGDGLSHNHHQARKWMKRAADHGHSKAQYEHGLGLFSEGDMVKAVVYLELATRAGETAAAHVKNVIVQQLPVSSRERAMVLADSWRSISASSH